MAPKAALQLSGCVNDKGDYEVPAGYGLLIRLNSHDGSVSIESVPDQHYTEIHPNCYAPADLTEVHLLYGGGSGTAVFHGNSPELGSIVMKHGGAKDTQEVFSLAEISRELLERSRLLSPKAADWMRSRIPEFVMVYLSPYHLRDRGAELWMSLRGAFWRNRSDFLDRLSSPTTSRFTPPESTRHINKMSRQSIALMSPNTRWEAESGRLGMRSIRIRKTQDKDLEMLVCLTSVMLNFPEHFLAADATDGFIADGIDFLKEFEEQLVLCQKEEHWKVTLAQKTIGGPNPQNTAYLLTSRKINQDLLAELVKDFTTVMKNLRELTLPEERWIVDTVRKEVERLRQSRDVTEVSKIADAFVGSAIRKNFHPDSGRYAKLRNFGERFRSEDFDLTDAEEIPGYCLGLLLTKGSPMSDVFIDPPTDDHALDRIETVWLSVLEHAVSLQPPSATECIWTCGLTDAGLHNTFLSKERGLELFDLGEPGIMPQPAFLTKFLMSFFHTAGMEEDGKGSWVRRFCVVGDKLALTQETKELIPYLEDAFQFAMNHLVDELFDGDDSVRQLLVRYVILQLLSDSAFCLCRWEQKGGGNLYRESTERPPLEKWLWRCIWDIYIAAYVYQIFRIKEH